MSQSLVLQGVITKISEVQTGESKAGKSWKKMGFAMETLGEYNKTVYFTVFGEEKVNNFQKYNKVGQEGTMKGFTRIYRRGKYMFRQVLVSLLHKKKHTTK